MVTFTDPGTSNASAPASIFPIGMIPAGQPFEQFAAMVEQNWEEIAVYYRLEEKIFLGFVGGMYTKIRVIQREAYGLRNEEYLRLKVLSCMLPEI